ncbi:protein kinase family protein [Euphorbia peplus]|nr:protein kinase family protein [Euphorbia peplus]
MAYFRTSEIGKGEDANGLTAIAIDADKNSQYAVRWAVDNLVTNKTPYCILIHVQCKTMHLGDHHHHHTTVLSKEGRPPTQQELQQFFLPYRGFCARRGIESKEIIMHDIDVSNALIDYIVHNNIANIVVGASQRNAITRKFKHPDIPTTLLKSAPETCAVYSISKGKVQTFRLASRPNPAKFSESLPSPSGVSSKQSPDSKLTLGSSAALRHSNQIREFTSHPYDSPRPEQASQISLTESWKSDSFDKISTDRSTDSMSIYNSSHENGGYNFKSIIGSSLDSPLSEMSSSSHALSSNYDMMSGQMSFRSACASSYDGIEFSNASASSANSNTEQYLDFLEAEMRRLKLELHQSMDLFNSVTKEAVLAKQMARDLHRIQTIETRKSGELKLAESAALRLASMENQRKRVAIEAAQAAKRLAEIEKQKKIAEMKVQQREAPVKPKDMESVSCNDFLCRKYTIGEIEEATDHFAPSNKIGEGGYGPVFKGMLSYFPVAIKMLRPDLSQGQKQFKQEVDVLSSMRHPHMVILLGACPEYGCLVYEYMENGSLEDRLYRKDNTPPLGWRTRFRIAYEIATALLFLHETKPEPLVHRDLKPANILLDYNFVSKIGDVGLARLVPPHMANNVTEYHMTAAAGTFCYIDPEYQQTGMLGVKSDLYSFGVVLLQLLTGRPPMGLSYCVEDAIEKGKFPQILDPVVKNWPVEEALAVAKISLQCCELRKKDRPELASEILPLLRRLRDLAVSREHVEQETVIPLSSPVDLVSDAQSISSEKLMTRTHGKRYSDTDYFGKSIFVSPEVLGSMLGRSRLAKNCIPTATRTSIFSKKKCMFAAHAFFVAVTLKICGICSWSVSLLNKFDTRQGHRV